MTNFYKLSTDNTVRENLNVAVNKGVVTTERAAELVDFYKKHGGVSHGQIESAKEIFTSVSSVAHGEYFRGKDNDFERFAHAIINGDAMSDEVMAQLAPEYFKAVKDYRERRRDLQNNVDMGSRFDLDMDAANKAADANEKLVNAKTSFVNYFAAKQILEGFSSIYAGEDAMQRLAAWWHGQGWIGEQ